MSRIGTPTVIGNYIRDEFVGDGTTTSFQLSAKPGSVNAIIVHVGNVYQHGSYSIFEDWLIFDNPIPNGTIVHTNILGRELQINHPADGSVDENAFQTERNPQIREALELVKQTSPPTRRRGGCRCCTILVAALVAFWRHCSAGRYLYRPSHRAQ